MERSRIELDATTLKALAHPLRMQIMRLLQLRRQASVTSLAEATGETTAAISYHLRQLARHGFVEEFTPETPPPPAEGKKATGRPQRWWREAVDTIHMSGFDMQSDPTTREAAQFLLRDIAANRARTLAHWFATATEWSETWQRASSDGDQVLHLDPARTRALADELQAVVERFASSPPTADTRPVEVQLAVFPADDGTRA
ncbi:ArsR/SmtB family transcription factor [Jatrophihabitans fulvus]